MTYVPRASGGLLGTLGDGFVSPGTDRRPLWRRMRTDPQSPVLYDSTWDCEPVPELQNQQFFVIFRVLPRDRPKFEGVLTSTR